MLEIEIQWLLAALVISGFVGFIIGALAKQKAVSTALSEINDFLNLLRGQEHSPMDNLRFLLAHLREGGPEEWSKLFNELNDLNVEKAKAMLDGLDIDTEKVLNALK